MVDPASTIATSNKIGRLQIHRKNYSGAVETYKQAIQYNETRSKKRIPDTYYHLGYVQKRLGLEEEAKASFGRAINEYRLELKEDGPTAILYQALGTALVESGDIAAAVEPFQQAQQLDPVQTGSPFKSDQRLTKPSAISLWRW